MLRYRPNALGMTWSAVVAPVSNALEAPTRLCESQTVVRWRSEPMAEAPQMAVASVVGIRTVQIHQRRLAGTVAAEILAILP